MQYVLQENQFVLNRGAGMGEPGAMVSPRILRNIEENRSRKRKRLIYYCWMASPGFCTYRRLCSKYVIPLAPGSFPRKVWEKQSPVTASSKILTNVPSFDFLFAQCQVYENDLSTKSDKCVKLILVIVSKLLFRQENNYLSFHWLWFWTRLNDYVNDL